MKTKELRSGIAFVDSTFIGAIIMGVCVYFNFSMFQSISIMIVNIFILYYLFK